MRTPSSRNQQSFSHKSKFKVVRISNDLFLKDPIALTRHKVISRTQMHDIKAISNIIALVSEQEILSDEHKFSDFPNTTLWLQVESTEHIT